ncbi:glycoside hydrolase family 97 protein [Danxiaibacter flavus]|uniref:Glycoside hydrolase family 97 protein n=1 Tax=Danxiaibacter flavus TaxID=3049108 RepID=A0ABV3ZAD1_9BACT|nr:glycoside hydrolase family 97 protein [Chitinophagaceae bacterium DXS]
MFHQVYRNYIIVFIIFFIPLAIYCQKDKDLYSPDSLIKVHLAISNKCSYAIFYNGQPLMLPSAIDLELGDGTRLSSHLEKLKISSRSIHEEIISPVPEKRRHIPDVYNELTVHAGDKFSIIFRAYNDGVAYRIATKFKDSIVIKSERAEFNFTAQTNAYYPEVKKRNNQDIYHTSFEEPYQYKPLDSISNKILAFSPVLVVPSTGPKVCITESDLEDYPGMFIAGTGSNSLRGGFAPYPKKEVILKGEYSQVYVSEREDYIANTKGTRSFPWRVLMIAPHDKDLPANDLVYRLASPSKVKDVSWVRPGKATDEWIITENLFNVPFRSGINTATYKYYIDFAKRFGFDRIMMDAGWSDNNDLFAVTPSLNMDEIAAYAKQQGVGLSMWTLAMTLDKQLEPALQQFKKWGVDFIMTDFIDRDDQKAVQFYYKIAEACARHQIMIMFHGAFKPAGFNRTYPNAITREAVLGSEYNIWSDKANPRHNLLLPFIRMTAGPMDYEPGMLDNGTEKTFRPIAEKVMSLGTRCQQLAMFVVYDSPMQFFAGNPSQGLLEPQFMELLGSIPTVWDTTIVLEGRVGEHIVTARRKNNDWYIGAMTNMHEKTFVIPLDFLDNRIYNATICEDGVNADRYASDYKLYSKEVSSNDSLTIKMAPGGGYMVRLKRK